MTQNELKVAGRIGAELGAARAEIEALREQVKVLQSDANSWQSGYDKGRHDGARHRKSEVEQLRGLLRQATELIKEQDARLDVDMLPAGRALMKDIRAALSQQAEPAPIQADTVNWKAVANEQKGVIEQLQAKLNAQGEPATAQDEREAFEAWAKTQGDKWLIVGGLQWSAGTDDYASARTNAAWAAWQERAARPAQAEQQPTYVECRECTECGHAGINDQVDGDSACSHCLWHGPSPDEDKCPECQREGTMSASCPQCGCRYRLIAGADIAAPIAQTAPRCQCCGYLVTDSEHRGCLRAATPSPAQRGEA